MLQIDDDADVLGGFVAHGFDAVDFLLPMQIGNFFYKVGLVDAIWNFGNDNCRACSLPAGRQVGDVGNTSRHHSAPARGIRVMNVLFIKNNAAGREVGAFDKLHQVFSCGVGIVGQMHGGIHHFAQVVRWDVRRHTDGDAESAVQKKIRYNCW